MCALWETIPHCPLPIISFINSLISFKFIYLFPDTEGLVAEISINANDGIQGIIGWQNIEYELHTQLFSTFVNCHLSEKH